MDLSSQPAQVVACTACAASRIHRAQATHSRHLKLLSSHHKKHKVGIAGWCISIVSIPLMTSNQLEHHTAGHKPFKECRKAPEMAAAGGFASWAKSVWLHPAGASQPAIHRLKPAVRASIAQGLAVLPGCTTVSACRYSTAAASDCDHAASQNVQRYRLIPACPGILPPTTVHELAAGFRLGNSLPCAQLCCC